jgi:hypothetical protein
MTHLKHENGATLDLNERPNGLHVILRHKSQMKSWVFEVTSKQEIIKRFQKEGFQ